MAWKDPYSSQKNWARRKRMRGLCVRCGQKRENFRRLCDSCQEKATSYMRRYRVAQRKAKIAKEKALKR